MSNERGPDDRPPTCITGVVVHGDRRGRQLGFPTANLRLDPASDVPRFGVYAARVLDHDAVVSVGVRPTFGHRLEPRLEAHVLDFDGDLYGREITVELRAFIRTEARFESLDALSAQIAADVAAARAAITTTS